MPNATIYLPRELAEQARLHGIPLSSTCQKAIARQVRISQRRDEAAAQGVARGVFYSNGSGDPEPAAS